MNEVIIKEISNSLNIKPKQVEVVLSLLSEGNTIPFIARYRKEATGALDEEVIRSINEVYEYEVNSGREKNPKHLDLSFGLPAYSYLIFSKLY